ncbi:MAG: protein tyrosine phosphatase family protein, partial [Burkholderiales bacterium]|nr:protein tyrosine phosphatase family protein [Burkholderiales bacterium]
MRATCAACKTCLIAALLFGSTTAQAVGDEPANFVSWRTGLSSSAQPNTAFLERAKSLGYDLVINLAPPEYPEAVHNEGAILAAQGVAYLNIPVCFGNPTAEDFRLFSDVLKSAGRKNVLVHCQINLRGSSFSYLYRVIGESANEDEARSKLTGVWMPNPVWKKFIESTLAAHGRK